MSSNEELNVKSDARIEPEDGIEPEDEGSVPLINIASSLNALVFRGEFSLTFSVTTMPAPQCPICSHCAFAGVTKCRSNEIVQGHIHGSSGDCCQEQRR